jgi:hypothetical protein
LAKPVRKHKLVNLWQHVLRRKAAGNAAAENTSEAMNEEVTEAAAAAAAAVLASGGGNSNANANAKGKGNSVQQQDQHLTQAIAMASQINPQHLLAANPSLIPTWANQLPQAIVEIAFKGNEHLAPAAHHVTAQQQQQGQLVNNNNNNAGAKQAGMNHSNSCSAFSAFIRRREGDWTNPSTSGNMMSFANPAQLGAVLPHPLQVSNLNIVQQHSGGFRGSGMLTLQDLSSMGGNGGKTTSGNEAATERRQEAIRKFREKKKARTFKKKVRYESRKRLAEARPRIKGQFVRPEVAAAAAAAAAAAGVAAGKAAKAEA